MTFETKIFSALSNQELFEIYKLRVLVFVVEQNCAYQEVDDKDKTAYHVMGFENGQLISYARILPPGISYVEPAIGRVVVHPEHRAKKSGHQLMKHCINTTMDLFQNQEIVISAQSYLFKFYKDLGFVSDGKEYLEDNIPHTQMRYALKSTFE